MYSLLIQCWAGSDVWNKHCLILCCADEPSRFPWLGDVSDQTISQLLVLAKLAYEGINENRLIFQEPSGTMESLGRVHSSVVCTYIPSLHYMSA